jgi:hypothetical protein
MRRPVVDAPRHVARSGRSSNLATNFVKNAKFADVGAFASNLQVAFERQAHIQRREIARQGSNLGNIECAGCRFVVMSQQSGKLRFTDRRTGKIRLPLTTTAGHRQPAEENITRAGIGSTLPRCFIRTQRLLNLLLSHRTADLADQPAELAEHA